jgi:uncharacterized protein (TIGR00297 family)
MIFRINLATLVPLLFAMIGWLVGGVTLSGAAAGFVVAFALFYCIGQGAFIALVAVFTTTWLATRFGYARKQRLGVAESRRGRDARQVLANLAVAAACAALFRWTLQSWATAAALAVLAEVAADTVSSECGQAWSTHTYLVTNFRSVAAGTDGGISIAGTSAGIFAAIVTTVTAVAAHAISPLSSLAVVLGAIAGSFIDSLLGATLERRGILGNNSVNFISTLSAAVIASLVALV